MPHLLTLRGRHALSPFRVAKLLAALAASRPRARRRRHPRYLLAFRRDRARARAGRAGVLERLLTYGPHDDVDDESRRAAGRRAAARHDLAVVVEGDRHRAGTAASTPVTRIERGIGYRVRANGGGAAGRARSRGAAAAAARPDDRGGAAAARGRARAVRPLSAARAGDDSAARRGRAAIEAANAALGLALAAGRDRLSRRVLPERGPRSDRRRADDVRAGELRALPAQDLQRRAGSSTASRRRGASSR